MPIAKVSRRHPVSRKVASRIFGEHRPDDNRSQRGISESAARTGCRVRNAPSLNHLRRRKFAHIAARFDLKCRMLNVETGRQLLTATVEKRIVVAAWTN